MKSIAIRTLDTRMALPKSYQTSAKRQLRGGMPLTLQGSPGRTKATGHGVAFLASTALDQLGGPANGGSAIVEGFGNVGSHAAHTLDTYGMSIRSVSDVHGAICNDTKIHLTKLRKHLAKHGTVAGFAEAEAIDPQEMLEQKCDILAPCAMELAILKDNAAKLRCKVLAEGAKRDRALDELTTSDRWKNDWHVEAPLWSKA